MYPHIHKDGLPLANTTWLETHRAAAPITSNTYTSFRDRDPPHLTLNSYDHVNGTGTSNSETETITINHPSSPPPILKLTQTPDNNVNSPK